MNGGTSAAKLKVGGDRRQLGKKKSGGGNNNDNYLNPIDRCLDYPGWESNRQAMANCPVGFGKDAVGGRDGEIYVVTTESDDNPDEPELGTLRYGVIMNRPKWITFKRDMVIRLKKDLVITQPFLTIDGRGADVKITGGPCLSVHRTTNIILSHLHIYGCVAGGNTRIRDSFSHMGWWDKTDGDGISIFSSQHIWVDHCALSACADGLVDAIHGSTAITVSNSYFTNHNKVMLLGHSDAFTEDKGMQVTVAYNHFGEGLTQRMPRCRHGYFHVVNNEYIRWAEYTMGGSASPTINSQGNRFVAPDAQRLKKVTKRDVSDSVDTSGWNWRTKGDVMINGAYFNESGKQGGSTYSKASSLIVMPFSTSLTQNAGTPYCNQRNCN